MKNSGRKSQASRLAECLLLGAVLALGSPRASRAWGRQAHQMVNAAAIENLPEPLRSYFRERRAFLMEHASDPDALSGQDPAERLHHFTDAEAYESYPFPLLRQQFVVKKRGPTARQVREGTSIWQIDLMVGKLADAWRRRDWDKADDYAVFLAHYASDLTQPLHTVLNYDGQFTKQAGIHGRFETELVNAVKDKWALEAAPAKDESNVRARIFSEFLASYSARNRVLAADRQGVRGRTYLDPKYFPAFVELAAPVAKQRLEAAVSLVSSLWYTAWVRAGKPGLGRSQSFR